MRLHFRGHDYDDPYVEWQVTEGEIVGKYCGIPLENTSDKKTPSSSLSLY